MGCGTSKAAQVAETEITTEPNPASRLSEEQVPDTSHANGGLSTGGRNKLLPQSSSTTTTTTTTSVSGDKTAPMAIVHSSPTRVSAASSKLDPQSNPQVTSGENSTMENTALERTDQAVAEGTLRSPSDRYAVFEVDMGHRGSTDPVAPPPKRLEKMEVTPRVTADVLAEKQREVQERKEKELSKRAHRVTRKERLRREIMEAREMEINEDKNDQIDKQLSNSEFEDDHSKDLVDGPVEMEVDQTYNLDTPLQDDWGKDDHAMHEVAGTISGGAPKAADKNDDTFHNWESNTPQEFQ